MGYYEETLNKIDKYIDDNNLDEAKRLIENELSISYVPLDFEKALLERAETIKELSPDKNHSLSDEQIIDYLNKDIDHELMAVDALSKRNLRDYEDIVNDYLSKDGDIYPKVLLVDSLIRQEISYEVKMNNNGIDYTFIPKYQLTIEESDGYLKGLELLEDYYLKEPSKYQLAKELLYEQMLLVLPLNCDEDEGIYYGNKVKEYIDNCFK